MIEIFDNFVIEIFDTAFPAAKTPNAGSDYSNWLVFIRLKNTTTIDVKVRYIRYTNQPALIFQMQIQTSINGA